jgi:hypothetical protein
LKKISFTIIFHEQKRKNFPAEVHNNQVINETRDLKKCIGTSLLALNQAIKQTQENYRADGKKIFELPS